MVVDGEAAGRRRRGLIIVAVIAVVGIPLTLLDWYSDREADSRANDLASDLTEAAEQIDDVEGLAAEASLWAGQPVGPDPILRALGHGEKYRGASFGDAAFAAAFETEWGLVSRCVHLVVRGDTVSTEVDDTDDSHPQGIE